MTSPSIRRTLCALSLIGAGLLSAGPATAQTVWRCGTDGRSFSDRPCPEGTPQTLQPAPSADAAAQGRADHDRVLAGLERLRTERLAREAQARVLGVAGFRPAERRAVQSDAKAKGQDRKKAAKRAPWEAAGPAS